MLKVFECMNSSKLARSAQQLTSASTTKLLAPRVSWTIAGRPCSKRHIGYQRFRSHAAKKQAATGTRQDKEGDIFDIVPVIASPIAQLINTPLYLLAEAAVLLGMLALVDAGYSGDWSRIGVIDKEMELMLQKLAQVLWSAHVVSGVLSAKVAQQQQRSTTVPFIKGFLFGLLGVFEQIEWDEYVAPKLADKKKLR